MAGERILGIVGGIGPESTLDYYRRIIDGWHARFGTESHPRVVIDSIESGPMIGPLVAGDVAPIRAGIREAVGRLAAAGAGLGLIASVASHAVFRDVAASSPIPMLSIVAATCRAARRAGVAHPVLFGTKVAVEGRYFAEPFEAASIDLIRPEPPDRDWIHRVYLDELVQGEFRASTRERLLTILRGLRDHAGADALILAGTELSVLLPDPAYDGLPVLNAAAIHVGEALGWLAGDVLETDPV